MQLIQVAAEIKASSTLTYSILTTLLYVRAHHFNYTEAKKKRKENEARESSTKVN